MSCLRAISPLGDHAVERNEKRNKEGKNKRKTGRSKQKRKKARTNEKVRINKARML